MNTTKETETAALIVPELHTLQSSLNWLQVEMALEALKKTPIQQASWKKYPYAPKATVQVGCRGDLLMLRFEVTEEKIQAHASETHGRVWEDSCVEFFFEPVPNEGYYNLEFNALGISKMAFGFSREGRVNLPLWLTDQVRLSSRIERLPGAEPKWTLTAIIPAKIFHHHHIPEFIGSKARGNFYKCGDLLPTPHFLSWKRIETPEPDFHQPKFFGDILFVESE